MTKDDACCSFMKDQLTNDCERHPDYCPNKAVSICRSQFFEGTLQLHAPNAEYGFYFCPWCGTHLGQGSIEELERDALDNQGLF